MKTFIILATLANLGLLIINHLKQKKIMATLAEFQAALDRINTATTDIAADIQSLKDQIAGAGLPADVENQVLGQLQDIATKLEGIGASVENPVPGEESPSAGGETTNG